MSPDTEEEVVEEGEPVEPIGHVRVVYLGPVAPHWKSSPTTARPR